MNYFICLWLSNYDRLTWEHFRYWTINYIQLISYSSSFRTSPGARYYTDKLYSVLWILAVCAVKTISLSLGNLHDSKNHELLYHICTHFVLIPYMLQKKKLYTNMFL